MKYIAIDFDGCLCENAFPEIGQVKPIHEQVHEAVKLLKKEGNKIILWTCREDKEERKYLTEAVEWCKEQGIEFDYINENPDNPYGDWGRKLYADIYIDDKAINPLL